MSYVGRVGLLKRVVQHACGDHLVGRPGLAEQDPDFDRVQDERRAIGRTKLPLMQALGIRECRGCLSESRRELRSSIRADQGCEP